MQKEDSQVKKNELLQHSQKFMAAADYQAAAACGQELLAQNGNDCDAMYILAMAYMNLAEYEKAIFFVQEIKRINENYIGAYMAEAYIYKRQGKISTEIDVLWYIIRYIKKLQAEQQSNDVHRKSLSEAWSLLGSAYTMLGKPKQATEAFLTSSKLERDREQSIKEYSNALFATNYIEDLSEKEMGQLHAGYQDFFKDVKQYVHFSQAKPKLRIGYISPDLRQHPVAFFVYPLLAYFDKEEFEVYCYAANSADQMTRQLQGFATQWREIEGLEAVKAARMIYEDGIDILIDLSGHTSNNCLPILAYKPAPVQISGIGYFNTTGLSSVDYFLSDIYCDPEEAHAEAFTEKILRLPHSHFCYVPGSDMPPCMPAPCKKNGYVTFGCFNNFNKVTDRVLRLWQQILKSLTGSKLILKSRLFDSEEGRYIAAKRLVDLGFDIERVDMRGFSADYLMQYHDVDIALDTYPYTGGMTTCEALYMGVPVITICGTRHGARFGYSLLQNAGLSELIAMDEQAYVGKAIAIASDEELLDGLHRELRRILGNSSLMNVKQYIKEMEDSYRESWQELLLRQNNMRLGGDDCEKMQQLLLACINQRDYRQAEAVAQNILQAKPQDRDVLGILAGIYIETGQPAAAGIAVRKLLQYYPLYGYGIFLAARVDYLEDKWDKAIQKSQQALRVSVDLTNEVRSMLYNLLGSSYKNMGEAQPSTESYLKASRYSVGVKGKAVDYSNYLFNLHYLPQLSQAELYNAHKKYNDLFIAIKSYHHVRQKKHGKIKIGYISPDMRYHVVTFFGYALFKNYDRNLFEVTCYAKCAEDTVSQQIAGAVDHWCNIATLDDATAAKRIHDDNIDILFDLSGHTRNNCLPILAYKPAPVQISGIGYFDTTGLAAIDYFLADCYTDPIGQNDEYFTEKILRLPHSHFCYVPPDTMPECAEAPFTHNRYVTFGSFNNFTKTTDRILHLWREILQRVPNSRLLLKSSIFGAPCGREKVEQRLKHIGFDLDRVELRKETREYLREYGDMDIALDTYPYPGGGTTCEALYMGVPVVTLIGDRHGTRFGYSILRNIGLDECCAESEETYVEIAVSLATDKEHLVEIHQNLREKMKASPVMDRKFYMQDLEACYLRIWAEYVYSEKNYTKLTATVLKNGYTEIQQAMQKNEWITVIGCAQTMKSFGIVLPGVFSAMASAYFKLHDYERSVEAAQSALDSGATDDAEMHVLLGNAYREMLDYRAALQSFLAADNCLNQSENAGIPLFQAEIKKSIAYLQVLLGLPDQGAENYYQTSLLETAFDKRCEAYGSYLLSLHYNETDEKTLWGKHCQYNMLVDDVQCYKHNKRKNTEKIRVGYISPDFRQHVMFYFYHQLLACYNKENFIVICYSLYPKEDNFTRHLKSLVDDWRNVSARPYAEIAQQIYDDKIDILFDLAGHSAGSGLPVLAYKPAPVQLSGLGYVNTTGLKSVDYFITDQYVDPVGVNDKYFSEQLIRLENSQFCYTGRSDVPSPKEEAPCREKGFVTFASFNKYTKITDDMLKMWLEILMHIKNSQLLLKSQVFVSSSAVEMAQVRLRQIGYDLKQVQFSPATDTYMTEYQNVDIVLDTFPYPGGGTTCDALYMGVPVITLYGQRHGSRFGYSILKNIGLEDLAVQDKADYIAKAVALANDWDLLDYLHKNLRAMMLKSPLMDERLYIQQMEQVYRNIWEKRQNVKK